MEKVLKDKGIKANVKKMKAFYTSRRSATTYPCKYSWYVCGKGVGRNLIICINCKNWVHKRCSRIQGNIAKAINFKCKNCQGFINENMKERITLDGNKKLYMTNKT